MPHFYLTDTPPNVQTIYKAMNPVLGQTQSQLNLEVGQVPANKVGGIFVAGVDEFSNNSALHNGAYTEFIPVAYVSSANVAAVNTATGLSLTANATAPPATMKRGDVYCYFDSSAPAPTQFFHYTFEGEI